MNLKKQLIDHFFTIIGVASGIICILDGFTRYKMLFIFLVGMSVGYYLCYYLHYRKQKSYDSAFLDELMKD